RGVRARLSVSHDAAVRVRGSGQAGRVRRRRAHVVRRPRRDQELLALGSRRRRAGRGDAHDRGAAARRRGLLREPLRRDHATEDARGVREGRAGGALAVAHGRGAARAGVVAGRRGRPAGAAAAGADGGAGRAVHAAAAAVAGDAAAGALVAAALAAAALAAAALAAAGTALLGATADGVAPEVRGALVVLALSSVAAAAPPPEAVPSRYAITLAPDLAHRTFSGRESIDVTLAAPTRTIALDAVGLAVIDARVEAGGETLAASVRYDEPAEKLVLGLPRAVAAGPARIVLAWKAPLSRDLDGFYTIDARGRRWAFTHFEPTSARRAFPSFDAPRYKARFILTVVTDAGDEAVSNTPVDERAPL